MRKVKRERESGRVFKKVVRTEYAVREENRQAGVHQCQDPFCMRRYRSGARCKLNGVFYRAKV